MRTLTVFVTLLAAFGCVVCCRVEAAPAVFRSFDGPDLVWQLADGRPGAELAAHGCVGDDARQGSGSERVIVVAPGGESLHFVCPVGRIPVLDELEARMWVKTSRPGAALAVRVVLPRSVDAKTGAAKTVLVAGEQCVAAGRWQQLRLAGVPNFLAAQVRVLRATSGTSIDAREAHVDAIVLAVPGGPGNTTVWTDALEVDGIVMPAVAESTVSPQVTPAVAPAQGWQQEARPAIQPVPSSSQQIQFQGTMLTVAGRPFLPLGVEWNNETFAFLAARGFNTIWLDEPPTPEQSAEATRAGIWLICTPPPPDDIAEGGLGSALDRVLAWHLGSPAGPLELDYLRRWAGLVRSRDPLATRPIVVAPRGDWHPASQLADVLVADHSASSNLTSADFAEWLQGLPLLARPGTPLWASIPTQPGERVRKQMAALLPGLPQVPTAIDDAQLDVLVTVAATNGCRGFLFKSDSPLDAGDEISKRRAVLVEQLNDRLELVSPWLTIGKRVGEATSADSTATGIVLQVERARLLVPTSWGDDVGDAASTPSKSVAFIVPGIPESNEAFLLSPAGLQTLPSKRVSGGVRIVVDRNADGFVLMTEDAAAIAGFRQRVAHGARRAAQLQYSLATTRMRSLAGVARRLQQLGTNTKNLDQAIGAANTELGSVNSLLTEGKFEAAYQRSSAARRILANAIERQRQAAAIRPEFNSIPYCLDQGSLARQAEFEHSLSSFRGGENQLGGGDFEDLGQLRQIGWQHIDDPVAGVQANVQLAGRASREGRYSLELSTAAVPPGSAPQFVARPLVWITSPPIRATAGEVLEISGWVRVTQPIAGSIDGLEIIDSLGGPELALRICNTTDWQSFRMFRGTTDTTDMTLTFALHGLGSVCVDGVMVRSLATPRVKRLPAPSGEPGPAFPNSARRTLFGPPLER